MTGRQLADELLKMKNLDDELFLFCNNDDEISISFNKEESCENCEGTGFIEVQVDDDDFIKEPCCVCDGEGVITEEDYDFIVGSNNKEVNNEDNRH